MLPYKHAQHRTAIHTAYTSIALVFIPPVCPPRTRTARQDACAQSAAPPVQTTVASCSGSQPLSLRGMQLDKPTGARGILTSSQSLFATSHSLFCISRPTLKSAGRLASPSSLHPTPEGVCSANLILLLVYLKQEAHEVRRFQTILQYFYFKYVLFSLAYLQPLRLSRNQSSACSRMQYCLSVSGSRIPQFRAVVSAQP